MIQSDKDITLIATTYMGKPAPATSLLAVAAVGAWAATFLLVVWGYLPLIVAFVLVSYLVYVTYTPLHEAVHNNIAGSNRKLRWLNELTGYLVASVLGVSYTMHKSAHLAHHRKTNIKPDDPDLVYEGKMLYDFFTGGPKMMANEYREYFIRIFPSAATREKRVVILEIIVFIGLRIALAIPFPLEVLVLGVLANVAGVMILGFIFAWLVHTPFTETARFRNTNTILMPEPVHTPVTWLWLWQNYHSIHHLFPRVPFFHYRALFEKIRPGMVERGAPIVEMGAST